MNEILSNSSRTANSNGNEESQELLARAGIMVEEKVEQLSAYVDVMYMALKYASDEKTDASQQDMTALRELAYQASVSVRDLKMDLCIE